MIDAPKLRTDAEMTPPDDEPEERDEEWDDRQTEHRVRLLGCLNRGGGKC
jgi:hypothetical protein